jgi:hypothetical protein
LTGLPDFPPPPGLCAAAVVMPTVLRPSVEKAVESVYAQDLDGPIHLLIGVDGGPGKRDVLFDLAEKRPDRVFVTVVDPGFSTSVRHGGLIAARDGGALRSVLSYLAHSRHIAYLDDDNYWAPDHLSTLERAIEGKHWAFSLRWFLDPRTAEPLCVDEWESVGPGRGYFVKRFGGFVDPNCLMVDKMACEPMFRAWCHPLKGDAKGMSADRNIFHYLKERSTYGATGKATVYYKMDPMDGLHPTRMARITARLDGAT